MYKQHNPQPMKMSLQPLLLTNKIFLISETACSQLYKLFTQNVVSASTFSTQVILILLQQFLHE